MKLYFIRHGLAGHSSRWKGDDAIRPLTKKGKKRLTREGTGIDKLGIKPDVIITSPLLRACQTAEIVAKELNMTDKLVEDQRLAPGFGVGKLSQIVRDHGKANSIVLVGHEPDFSTTISHLVGGGEIICKKGSLVYVDLPNRTTMKGALVWLIPPKALAL